MDLNGNICINLDDYKELSNSIRFRHKIDYLMIKYNFPAEISHFSITIIFKNGQRYYLSNLYLWAIPYRTEGLYRGDIDHDYATYNHREFFIQSDIIYDEMQISITRILESRYSLYTVFAMVRQSLECDVIFEAYNSAKINDPKALYYNIRNKIEDFLICFINEMQQDIISTLPVLKNILLFSDTEHRKKVIKRQSDHEKILTHREIQCLALLAEGWSIKETANKLNISDETVNTHSKAIRRKLNSKNITQAVMLAHKYKLFES